MAVATDVAGARARADFQRDGYLLLGKVLDDALVARLIAEEHRFRARDARLVVTTQLMHRSALIREVATQGPHIGTLRTLMGNDICLTHQQYVSKTPHPRTPAIDVPWHQDNGYGELEPKTDVTVWFALDDCDESTGCLWVLPARTSGRCCPTPTCMACAAWTSPSPACRCRCAPARRSRSPACSCTARRRTPARTPGTRSTCATASRTCAW
jgi:hypothetical protein